MVMGVAYGLIFVPAIEAARRGGFLSTSGAFTMSSGNGRGNRAGNDELKEDAELREAMRDEDLYPIEDDRDTYLDLVEEAEGESARAVKHHKHIKEQTSTSAEVKAFMAGYHACRSSQNATADPTAVPTTVPTEAPTAAPTAQPIAAPTAKAVNAAQCHGSGGGLKCRWFWPHHNKEPPGKACPDDLSKGSVYFISNEAAPLCLTFGHRLALKGTAITPDCNFPELKRSAQDFCNKHWKGLVTKVPLHTCALDTHELGLVTGENSCCGGISSGDHDEACLSMSQDRKGGKCHGAVRRVQGTVLLSHILF